jgi:hypothetical protein
VREEQDSDDFGSGVGSTQHGAEHLMTQTILDAFDGAQRGYSARDREGNLWSFGTMNPGAKQ